MTKLQSFTIIELIVVLLINSLLIILSLTVVINLNRFLGKEIIDQNAENEVLWFYLRLKSDIMKSDYVTGNSEILRIYKNNNLITYEIYPQKILLCENDETDTIPFIVKNLFVGHLVPDIVNYLEMSVTYHGLDFALQQNKEYSPRFLFQQWNKQNKMY